MHESDVTRLLEQRNILAELGAYALRTTDVDTLLQEICRGVAEGLGVRFCKFLDPLPGENAVLVRAGVGWHPGVVGHAKLEADSGSPAGHALKTGDPVLSHKLSEERRFRTPPLLLEHGIETAMNVIVRGEHDICGVLEADSPRAGHFHYDDIAFIQAAANLLGLAIERTRRETRLKQEVATRELLMREADHRIKNSLQLVASLLTMQRSRLTDHDAGAALDEAIARVHAVAHTHRAFQQSTDLRRLPFGEMMRDICRHVGGLNARIRVECDVVGDLELDSERAIPLGLIVSEWLTNAMRHAYLPDQQGVIRATASASAADLSVEISDDGAGMPDDPAGAEPSLGTTIVRALVRQIGAEQQIDSLPGQGTVVRLRLPRLPEASTP